jgi:hypothetical protein
MTSTLPAPAGTVAATELLRTAHQTLADHSGGTEDHLGQAAMYLISCAADVVALLPSPDLEAAREALGCARAAVVAASYAVHKIHDDTPGRARSRL